MGESVIPVLVSLLTSREEKIQRNAALTLRNLVSNNSTPPLVTFNISCREKPSKVGSGTCYRPLDQSTDGSQP